MEAQWLPTQQEDRNDCPLVEWRMLQPQQVTEFWSAQESLVTSARDIDN